MIQLEDVSLSVDMKIIAIVDGCCNEEGSVSDHSQKIEFLMQLTMKTQQQTFFIRYVFERKRHTSDVPFSVKFAVASASPAKLAARIE